MKRFLAVCISLICITLSSVCFAGEYSVPDVGEYTYVSCYQIVDNPETVSLDFVNYECGYDAIVLADVCCIRFVDYFVILPDYKTPYLDNIFNAFCVRNSKPPISHY